MQLHRKLDSLDKFVADFRQLDDSVLISPAHWAALTSQSRASVYTAKQRACLPAPAIEKNRFVRWTVGQYRSWVNGLVRESQSESKDKPKAGRPRISVGKGA